MTPSEMMSVPAVFLMSIVSLVFVLGPVLASAEAGSTLAWASLQDWSPTRFNSVDDALRLNPLLSTLRKALVAADLDGALNDPQLVATVVAPTNGAFSRLLKDLKLTQQQLFDDKDLLTRVLQYHVVAGAALKADDLHNGQIEETLLSSQYLTFHKEPYLYCLTKVTVSSDDPEARPATVVLGDVEAAKTVIHVINRVLLPDAEKY